MPNEMDQIYAMGFDAWSEGLFLEEYLQECRNSVKYKKGIWFVLSQANNLFSALIVYKFDEKRMGIGSIATPKEIRKNGYASLLVQSTIKYLQSENPDILIFLYSDISVKFYEKFGFIPIQAAAQQYQTSTCMVIGNLDNSILNNKLEIPEYF